MSVTSSDRLTEMCAEFRLPTLATELVQRLVAAGHEALIPLVAGDLRAGGR